MCTRQLVKLQGRLDELRTDAAAVFAISINPPAAARQVVEGHKLAFPILSETLICR